MRIKALVVEGTPADKMIRGAVITWDAAQEKPKVEFFDAAEYAAKDLYEVYPKIYERFGKGVSIAGYGMAAEHGYGNAGIAYNDLQKHPSRYSGRGGLGSVMASKALKFIVIDTTGAPGVQIADKALFEEGLRMALRKQDPRPQRKQVTLITVKGGLPRGLDLSNREAMYDWFDKSK